MKLDTEPFPTNVINFEDKKELVRPSQADTTQGKEVIVSDKPRVKMIKPRSLEPGVWKVNYRRWSGTRVKPSTMLLKKYTRKWRNVFQRLGSIKRARMPSLGITGHKDRVA
jgi:hypothetical protein